MRQLLVGRLFVFGSLTGTKAIIGVAVRWMQLAVMTRPPHCGRRLDTPELANFGLFSIRIFPMRWLPVGSSFRYDKSLCLQRGPRPWLPGRIRVGTHS